MSSIYDVAIIGSGPAGHSASVYCSRGMLKTILFEGNEPNGQLAKTTDVENYLGFPEGINGYDLCVRFKQQSERWGTKIISEYVERIVKEDRFFKIYYDDLNKYILSKSVIICSGSVAKKLSFNSSDLYWNKGITACAVCHGALPIFRNKPLFIVGGGDTAMEDALYLTKYSSQVYIIHRRDEFRASKIMQERVFNNNRISVLWNTEVVEAYGNENDKFLEKIKVKNIKSGEETVYNCNGLFYAIGHDPCVSFLKNSNINIELDDSNYIITQNNSTKTNIDGIFAAGDVLSNDKKFKQAIVAAGSGCKAALEVVEYLQENRLNN